MKGVPTRTQGLIASGLMAILVLSVFARSAYTGPESTLYQLHNGVLEGDYEAVKDTLLQDPRTAPAQNLILLIQRIFSGGAQIKEMRVGHAGRDAVVEVIYVSRALGVVGVRFYLQKPRSRWLVDADRTGGLAIEGQAPIR